MRLFNGPNSMNSPTERSSERSFEFAAATKPAVTTEISVTCGLADGHNSSIIANKHIVTKTSQRRVMNGSRKLSRQEDVSEADFKSRSLERYERPPHMLAMAASNYSRPQKLYNHNKVAGERRERENEDDDIYTVAKRTLSPSLSTQRKRLLAPFVSIKRCNRNTNSNSIISSRNQSESREVIFHMIVPPLKLPGPMQQHIFEQQNLINHQHFQLQGLTSSATSASPKITNVASDECVGEGVVGVGNSAGGDLHEKHLETSTSSQSGDSGTGGTELEQDTSRTSAAESSQLSLSYSQLSSSNNSISSSHSFTRIEVVNSGVIGFPNTNGMAPATMANDLLPSASCLLKVRGNNYYHQEMKRQSPPNACSMAEEAAPATVTSAAPNRYRDSVFSTDENFCCGNFTLIDDEDSNYEPQNDAEAMFLQVVGILRTENEVGSVHFTLKMSPPKEYFY